MPKPLSVSRRPLGRNDVGDGGGCREPPIPRSEPQRIGDSEEEGRSCGFAFRHGAHSAGWGRRAGVCEGGMAGPELLFVGGGSGVIHGTDAEGMRKGVWMALRRRHSRGPGDSLRLRMSGG